MPDDPATPSPETPRPDASTQLAKTGQAGGSTWRNPPTPGSGGASFARGAAPGMLGTIGDFEVLGKLGEGGMGAVYRARQVSLDRQVALKILPPQLEADPEFVTRFQREARIAASLSHPNLVRVYSSGQADGCHYIAMELIEGETLGQWLKRGALPFTEALRITLDVVHALECGWRSAHLIHRDIKPGNIFLSQDGAVKLGDLGLAKTVGSDTTGLTQTGTAMGTPHYISPEQARGDSDLDFRADIYSLGCTLYQMLTGHTPYTGSDPVAVFHQHIHGPPPAILKALPHCPLPLARLIGKMLKKQRRERHASYEELIAHIESVQAIFAPASASPLEKSFVSEPETSLHDTPATQRAPEERRFATAGKDGGDGATAVANRRSLVIAAGVAALAIVVFLAWPRQEKLTQAERYARAHARERNAGAGANDPGPASLRPAPTPAATKPWQPLMAEVQWFGAADGREIRDGLLHLSHNGLPIPEPWADGAIRARIVHREGASGPGVIARASNSVGSFPQYRLGIGTDATHLFLGYMPERAQAEILCRHFLPRPLAPGDRLLLELRVQGDHLTGLLDGTVVLQARDARIAGPGRWGITASEGWFESAEVQPLPALVGTASATLNWTPILTDVNKASFSGADKQTLANGAIQLDHGSLRAAQPTVNAAIRAHVRVSGDFNFPAVLLRAAPPNHYKFGVRLDRKTAVMRRFHEGGSEVLGTVELPTPLAEGSVAQLELRVQGTELTGWINGEKIVSVTDAVLTEPGEWGVMTDGLSVFERIEGSPLPGPGSRAASASEPPAIKFWDAPEKLPKHQGVSWQDGALRIEATSLYLPSRKSRDAILRASVRMSSDNAGGASLAVRHLLGRSQYTLAPNFTSGVARGIELRATRAPGPGKSELLGSWPLPRSYGPEEWARLELRAIGDEFTAIIDGHTLGTVRDSSTPEPGDIGLAANRTSYFRDIEYVPLDGAAIAMKLTPEPWQDVLRDPAKLKLHAAVERVPDGLRITGAGAAWLNGARGGDGAIRMRTTFGGLRIGLLATEKGGSSVYRLFTRGDKEMVLDLFNNAAQQRTDLRVFPLPEPLQPGRDYEVELRAVGLTLTAKFNGEILGSVTDGTGTLGNFGAGTVDDKGNPVLVKSLEFVDLDASAALTKDTTRP